MPDYAFGIKVRDDQSGHVHTTTVHRWARNERIAMRRALHAFGCADPGYPSDTAFWKRHTLLSITLRED